MTTATPPPVAEALTMVASTSYETYQYEDGYCRRRDFVLLDDFEELKAAGRVLAAEVRRLAALVEQQPPANAEALARLAAYLDALARPNAKENPHD